jgi:hypothetical protein
MASPSAAIFWAEAHFTFWTLASASGGQTSKKSRLQLRKPCLLLIV